MRPPRRTTSPRSPSTSSSTRTSIDGTVISNQGFVTAVDGGIVDQPSDDPATPTVNDPTRDIVGNLPLLFAAKSVVLFGRPGLAGRRRSGRRAALHDQRAELRHDRRDRRRAARSRSRRTRPTSRTPRLSTGCRSASRTAASRRSLRASTSAPPTSRRRCRVRARARSRRAPPRCCSSTCASTTACRRAR